MTRQPLRGSSSFVRLEDVARRAGVSLATASRAIHGAEGRVVAVPLRERVLAAAVELGYVPNSNAQAMARGRAEVLGLVVHDIADPFFSTVSAGVMSVARRSGVLVSVAVTDRDPEQELEHVKAFRRNRSRGLVLVGSRSTSRRLVDELARELVAFGAEGGRAVAISQPRLPVDTIAADNRSGSRALAAELAMLGYRSFAVLAGPRQLLTAVDRSSGFRQGAFEAGIRIAATDLIHGDFTRDGGYEAMAQIVDAGRGFECVFAVNDVMAVGAIACLRDRGVAVPDEVAVAGFDDISMLRDVTPSLTTVRLPLELMGETAGALALTPAGSARRLERIPAVVVVRASTPRLGGRRTRLRRTTV